MQPGDQPSSEGDDRGWKAPATGIQPFSESAGIRIHTGNLPHWEQNGTTYFITFRLGDSLPAGKLRELQIQRQNWLRAHGLDDTSQLVSLTLEQQRDYRRQFDRLFHEWLDAGHGDCTLRGPDCRSIIAGALQHADGDGFALGDFVVMPNHVHLLVKPVGGTLLARITQSWKGWSAREINRLLGRRGTFWQAESYDHIVRDAAEWSVFAKYIRGNPEQAHLPATDYTLGYGKLGRPP